MKKYSLLKTLSICTLLVTSVHAQVIMSQNFDAPAMPALPTGWTQNSSSAPGWKTANFVAPMITGWGTATGTVIPAHATQVAVIDDWTVATANNLQDTLKSVAFSLAGTTQRWLNFRSYYYDAYNGSTGLDEDAYVLGSNNGGATWTVLDTIDGFGFDAKWHTQHVSLASLGTGTNNKIAFTYSDNTDQMIGIALDSVEVINLTSRAATITALDYNSAVNGISANGEPVSFTIENRGIPVSSLSMYYRINGGAPVVQSFGSLSMAPYATQTFTFTTPISGAVAGTNTIKVAIISVNGLSNTATVDTVRTSTFTYASSAVQRHGLIEQFSSSTSYGDHYFNDSYNPICSGLHADSVGGNFNLIKYQMNWPAPGDDRSYNADGLTRRTYYNVNAIPNHFVNGVMSNLPWSDPFTPAEIADFTNEINNASARRSFFDIAATYTVDTVLHKLNVIVNVTPHFTKTGNYHLYTSLLDKHYQNITSSTGELNYYHVMRKMVHGASGYAITSWVDGVTQTFYDTAIAYTNGNWVVGSSTYPTAMSNKFWSNPLPGSELVTFIQEDANKSVMQSLVAAPVTACPLPVAGTISGPSVVCESSTITLIPSVPGGTWSSSWSITATVGITGLVTGVSEGYVDISYTVSNSCGSATVVKVLTVDPLPEAGSITGPASVCEGNTITLFESTFGGTWSSSAPGIASVSGIGDVTGVAGGAATISYSVTNSCGTDNALQLVTVVPLPDAGTITGPDTICVGASATMFAAMGGGTWSVISGSASITGGGLVIGITSGTDTAFYTVSNSCGTDVAKKPIIVQACTTGVDQVLAGEAIQILPNPAKDVLTILAAQPIRNITIRNAVGQDVYSGAHHEKSVTIDIRDFPAGIYLVKVNGGNVYKLIKL